jgi:hypothetical protein
MTEKVTLANTMKDMKLLSDRYIYEYIFNMNEEQWLAERVDVVEDLKLRFRQNQIEQEGNDPTVTGVSYGTPHDLATVHMSSNDVEEKDKGGRPPEGIKFGQHKNAFGWDPLGTKQIKQAFDPENQKTAFQPHEKRKATAFPVRVEQIVKHMPIKTKNIITETLNTKTNDPDKGTLLDENNIL